MAHQIIEPYSLIVQTRKLDEKIKWRSRRVKGYESISSLEEIDEQSGSILLSITWIGDNFINSKIVRAYLGAEARQVNPAIGFILTRLLTKGINPRRTRWVRRPRIASKYSPGLNQLKADLS